ncbi:WecB/TagA/CpsF family glycosyltransferase [Pontibacter sp. SD6]|uniref:WecB/TagA/CpsF family glycosyltransferase n=2 Tax=Pontibacter cellulosilyticus TaxID=1720253 RepID=A0A923SIA0_9BACT|nr:WecB/TagA/CpsF family glycosyltransferase [Pontibacter cellulosilyticus]
MGYPIFTGSLNTLPFHQKTLVNTINQYSYCIAEGDAEFKNSLLKSDVLLPDGIGIVAASRFIKGKKIFKIAGADLHQHLLKKLAISGGRCFYLGSSEETLSKIKKRLAVDFPSVQVGTYSPPFKANFSEEDSEDMIFRVNVFKPDVLFIGMTAPKQEKWAFEHKENLDAKMICSIGAVFDFYSGRIKRPGKLWIKFGLEWLVRLVKEPKRMWKRYIYYGAVFGFYLFEHKFKQLTYKFKKSHMQHEDIRTFQNN